MTSFPSFAQNEPAVHSGAAATTERGFRKSRGITLAILCLIAFLGGLFPIESGYLWDEAVYLSMAENLGNPDPYYEEFSFRPPLFPILIRIASVLAPLELAARLLSAASFGVGVLFLFLLGEKLYGFRAGLFAAGLMTASPFFLHWTHKVMTDVCSTSFAIVSMYFLVRHVEAEEPAGPASAVLAGIMLGISTLTRFLLLLAGIWSLYLFLTGRIRFRSALWYAGGFLAIIGPYLLWARARYGSFFAPFVKAIEIAGGEPVAGRAYYLEAIYVVAGPLAALGLVCYAGAALAHGNLRWTTTDVPLWLWHLTFLIYLTVSVHKEVRYILPAIPPLFLLAGWGFARLSNRWVRAAGALAAGVAALFTLQNLPYFDGSRELGEEFLLARSAQTCRAARDLQGQLTADEVIYSATLYPLLGYCAKHRTFAVSPQDDSFYAAFPQNMPANGYLVTYKDVPKAPSPEWLAGRREFQPLREFGNVVVYKYTRGASPSRTR